MKVLVTLVLVATMILLVYTLYFVPFKWQQKIKYLLYKRYYINYNKKRLKMAFSIIDDIEKYKLGGKPISLRNGKIKCGNKIFDDEEQFNDYYFQREIDFKNEEQQGMHQAFFKKLEKKVIKVKTLDEKMKEKNSKYYGGNENE